MYDWQAIIEQHGSAVWATAYRILGDHDDSADCFQDTFVAALKLTRRESIENIRGLLLRLATTRAIDRLRQRTRWRNRRARLARPDGLIGSAAAAVQQTQDHELAVQLRQALAMLSPHEAKVFCLRHLNEMSYERIAQEMNIRSNAVGVLLHRAKKKLGRLLTAIHEERQGIQP